MTLRQLRRKLLTLCTVVAVTGGLATVFAAQPAQAATGTDIANLALQNQNKKACSTNSLGGTAFFSSCTGNGGQPEYWCADFARWVWAQNDMQYTSELTAAAASFYSYGTRHNTLSTTPQVGDAAVFSATNSTSNIHHVGVVTAVNGDGTVNLENGDFDGQSGTEAQFASTSYVKFTTVNARVGSYTSVEGYYLVDYVMPVGITAAPPTAPISSLAVYRSSNATFYIRAANGSLLTTVPFGQTGDLPAVGHYDNSAYDDLAVYRPSNATFYIRAANGSLLTTVPFGQTGDLPAIGHYDNSAYDDLAVYRPSNATFYIRAANGSLLAQIPFGQTGDLPAIGHYENSSYDNLAVYRPSNATFYIRAANGSLLTQVLYGNKNDVPAVGHYESIAYDNLAVYRPSTATFYIRKADGSLLTSVPFGQTGDTPAIGHFQ